MKVLVAGHARHGKDCTAAYIQDELGLTFESSSLFAAEAAVIPYLAQRGVHYDTVHDAYQDRHQYRAEWKQAISEYNTPDKSRLTKELLSAYDMYVGMRAADEFAASKHLFDLTIWVDASKRKPPEPTCGIKPEDCDLVILNNGTERELQTKVKRICRWIK